jgi:hypothetical protein
MPPPFQKKKGKQYCFAFHPRLPKTSIKRKATWIKSRFVAAFFEARYSVV